LTCRITFPATILTNRLTVEGHTCLRTALGDQAYESLARKGEAMATYACDQIVQARAVLNAVSK